MTNPDLAFDNASIASLFSEVNIESPYEILFQPQHGGIASIEISTFGENKYFYLEVGGQKPEQFPQGGNVLKNRKNEIRKKVLKLVKKVLNKGF